MDFKAAADQLKNDLRLRTEPLGVAFLKKGEPFPEKTRQPSKVLGKRVTICQGVTMARVYGWAVGLTADDLICAPALLAFGLSPEKDAVAELSQLFCDVGFHAELGPAITEISAMPRLEHHEIEAIYLCPLERLALEPQVVALYGNPAQIMRLAQAASFAKGQRVSGSFGGKVECSSYLIGPYKTGEVRLTIPGAGDRIFSMTQDDEMVISFPASSLEELLFGLKEAGRKMGARYPVTFYQNFQPQFPPQHRERLKKWGIEKD